ncbi:MAG: DEAD/DEAH box helicase [Vulcanimicrobiaceae bacterium]
MGDQQTVVKAAYEPATSRVILESNDYSPAWITIWSTCYELTDDVSSKSLTDLSLPGWVLFSIRDTIRFQVELGALSFEPDETVFAMLQRARHDERDLTKASEVQPIPLDEIIDRLRAVGFVRRLTDRQLQNVARLTRLTAAAEFSVPGAGKTTTALAFYALKRAPSDRLLVVAPINAFAPWEEQVALCFGSNAPGVVRLVGGADDISRTLAERPDVALINYHRLAQPGVHQSVAAYLGTGNVFMFLDESHKIKRGEGGAWGNAVLSIAHLPKGKLVMSGTPLPNSEADLVAQLRFLHPEADVDEGNVRSLIQPIFVRTTKAQLGLPDPIRRAVPIPLAPGQRRLYDLLSSEVARQAEESLTRRDRGSIRRLGRSVLRLLKFVSNPALLIGDLERSDIGRNLRDVLLDEDSRKIEYACIRARSLAKEGKKCIIWSSFVDNVEVIASRLADIGADFIHGGVDIGSDEDDTRERKIKLFHENPRRFVLVANPAAAGESISLHTVCHNAIYIDRTYNAAQFLQSEDRIHRVGLPDNVETEVEILVAPRTIDNSVDRRLNQKVKVMSEVMNDPHLRIEAVDSDISDDGLLDDDVIDFLESLKAPA